MTLLIAMTPLGITMVVATLLHFAVLALILWAHTALGRH